MSGKVIGFVPKTYDAKNALEVLDDLRTKIESGEVIGFVAAGFSADDTSYAWASSTTKASRLRMIGAMSNALWHYNNGGISDDE